jgi:hypothetical protein
MTFPLCGCKIANPVDRKKYVATAQSNSSGSMSKQQLFADFMESEIHREWCSGSFTLQAAQTASEMPSFLNLIVLPWVYLYTLVKGKKESDESETKGSS